MNRQTEKESDPLVVLDHVAMDAPLKDLPEDGYYHVVVLSNFAAAFDKYSQIYDKSAIPESTFPNQFFVLRRNEIHVGISKAKRLIQKLALEGNRLLLLRVHVDASELKPNIRTGLGQYVEKSGVLVLETFLEHEPDDNGNK